MYPGDLSLLSSVGWLTDRTAERREVIGSAWMIRDGEVITCANLLLPFVDHPESLAIEFPLTKNRFGVKEFKFHNNFDRWMGKRKLLETQFYPDQDLSASLFNIAGVKLTHTLKALSRDTLSKLKAKVTYNQLFEEPDLTGQADNLQIVSILQTLMNARNIGTMMLVDDLDRVVARFYLCDQQITHIQYQNLVNEQALNKLICCLDGELKFKFIRELDPKWASFPALGKPTAGILLSAYSILEEATALYKAVGGKSVEIMRSREDLSLVNLTEAQCPPVACVWNHIKFPVSISRVVTSCSFDGATVLNALKYLVDSGQAQLGQFDPPSMDQIKPLSLTNDFEMRKGMEIYSFSADQASKKGIVDMGYVLDPVPDSQDNQYIHSIGLPLEAIGAPIIANNQVIGLHSGWLIKGFENYKEWIHPGILISAESIYECMDLQKPGVSTSNSNMSAITKEDETLFEMKPINVNERLTEDDSSGEFDNNQDKVPVEESASNKSRQEPEEKKTRVDPNKLSGFFKSVAGMISSISTTGEGLDIQLHRQSLDSERYERIDPSTKLLIGDFIQLRVKILSDCSVLALFRAGPEQPIEILYSNSDHSKGEHFTIPTEPISIVSAGVMQTYSGFPLNFREQESEIVLAFSFDQTLDIFNTQDEEDSLKSKLVAQVTALKNLQFNKYNLTTTEVTADQSSQINKTEKGKFYACHLTIKA